MNNTQPITLRVVADELHAQNDKIRDIQCLLDAIGKFNPGGHEDRLAAMAEKQLEDLCAVLERLSTAGGRQARGDHG